MPVATLTAPTVKQVLKRSSKKEMIMSFKLSHEPTPSCPVINLLGQVKKTKTMRATANILLFPYNII